MYINTIGVLKQFSLEIDCTQLKPVVVPNVQPNNLQFWIGFR